MSPQKTGGHYAQSSADFVTYLEKENEGMGQENRTYFFNQYEDEIGPEEVIREIDRNTAKLKRTESKFYSITINPSQRELTRLKNSTEDLRQYTRELMKDYVKAFNREIDGRPIRVDDIKYYAKIEYQRKFKGHDKEVRENQPYATRILNLKHRIRAIEEGRSQGNIKILQEEIDQMEKVAPHQQGGKRIVQGMLKPGNQSHIHIIMSRKDTSNRYSLSPGSRYKASTVEFNGKTVKRGFNRNQFFQGAERTFDKMFGHQRNYTETYRARKQFIHNPKLYFAALLKLPVSERESAFKLMHSSGVPIMPRIPTTKAQLALRTFKRLRRGLDRAAQSASIGVK